MFLRLLSQCRRWRFKPSTTARGMADWFRPKFEGGDAQPHELWKFFKQYMYTDGEKIIAFSMCVIIPIGICIAFLNEDFRNKKIAWADYNCRTMLVYPIPKRIE